jgi:hypothetical protein
MAYQKRIWFVALLILLTFSLVACQKPDEVANIDQSTPEAVVRALYKAFEQMDAQGVKRLVLPSDQSDESMTAALNRIQAGGLTIKISDLQINVISNDGQQAHVAANSQAQVLKGNTVVWSDNGESSGEFTLTNLEGKWYFVGLGQWPAPGWVKP